MVAPALGQPAFLAHAKDPEGLASRAPRRGRRNVGKMKGNVAASLKKSNSAHDNRILSAFRAAPPPPPPPPPTNVLKTTNGSQPTPPQQGTVKKLATTTPPEIHRRPLESYNSWDYINHQASLPSVVATRSDDLTVSTIASPRQGILSERFRTTRAIHHTDALVLDAVQEEENDPSVALEKTQHLSIMPAPSSVTATTVTTASGSVPSKRSPTESENSDSTKMIRNHSSYEKDGSVTPPKRRLKTRTPERVKTTEKDKRPKTPKRLRLALRPKKNAVATSFPKRTTPQHRVTASSEIMKKDVDNVGRDETASSKGFFGKLFRTGKKKQTIAVPSTSDESTLQTETRSETTAPVNQSCSEDDGKEIANSRVDAHVSKHGSGPFPRGNGDSLHRGRTVHYHGYDEVSTLTAPTFSSLGRRSLDPDSSESILSQRVHEPTGLYLKADERVDIDTVASYAGSTNDPPEKDEDSPTTVNTRRTSIDPTDDTPRTRGSEPRESRVLTSQSFRDPSPRHLLRDPSPTNNTTGPSFDFDVASPREKTFSASETQESSRSSPLNYLRAGAPSHLIAPDPPLNSTQLADNEPKDEKSASFRHIQNGLPPPPPPPRQNSSHRSIVIQLPNSKDENVHVRSPHHHTMNGSPPGILRTALTNGWKGTHPIDSDLILAMEYGVSDQKKVFSHVSKGNKSKHFSMMKAARFSTKTITNQHKQDITTSPRRSCDQYRESDDFGSRTQIVKINGTSQITKAGTPKASLENPISYTTFIGRNERFKNRTRIQKQKRANAVSKGGDRRGPRRSTPFSIGASILRRRREHGIASRKHHRVEPKTKGLTVNSKKNKPVDTIDPIQRAGIRVLSKSAVPIQSAARRFLAQREAIDRMWGILEIQCYMRRWKAEATLLAYQCSARTIQRVFRGTQVRKNLEVNHLAAIEVQKVIRGYLACASTFDTVYRIIVVQSVARGFLVRTRMRRFEEKCRALAATQVQQWWRCMSCQMQYQSFIVDVLIIQSALRRWKAQREYKTIMNFRRTEAARCIQAAWRGFQCYTDYIFSLVDVVNVQRTARRWLAIRKVEQMRRDRAATLIQSQIRKYSAQYKLLLSLMNTILIQSTLRMFLAKKLLTRKRAEYQTRQLAAAKIQAAYRGFSTFTDYIITHYHILKFQSLFRGLMVRRQARLRLGSIVIIQSHARKFLAQEKTRRLLVDRIFAYGQSNGMRGIWAANRIQFWWRVVLDCRKEKHAALVIERFFLMVKREVDMEIARVQRRHMEKLHGKQEKLVLDTVQVEISESTTNKANKYIAAPTSPRGQPLHRVKKSASIVSSDSLNFTYSADDSEVSGTGISYIASRQPNQQTAPRTAAEKYASMYGIRTKKSKESKQKNHYLGEIIENSLSSGSSIHGIQFTTSPGSTVDALSPLGSPSGTMVTSSIGTKAVKHFDFDVHSDDEFGLI